jgi:hypothetical protein
MPGKLLPALADSALESVRGERLHALIDAATDVAQGSANPRLRSLAREVLNSARTRGLLAS